MIRSIAWMMNPNLSAKQMLALAEQEERNQKSLLESLEEHALKVKERHGPAAAIEYVGQNLWLLFL